MNCLICCVITRWPRASHLTRSLGWVGIISLSTQLATAQLINLNFSTNSYTGTSESSPATPGGPAGTWNSFTNSTENGVDSYETDSVTVLQADGSNGPTLTLDSGRNSNWSQNNNLGTRDFTGVGSVYDVPDLYESGITNGSGGQAIGYRLRGLPAGEYEVFAIPFYRGMVQEGIKLDSSSLRIGLGNDLDERGDGDYTLTATATSTTVNINTALTTWVAATDGSSDYNYLKANVTIDSSNRWLTFVFDAPISTEGGDRNGLSMIQIRSGSIIPTDLLGDFNQDESVDAADYTVWRDNLGRPSLPNSGTLSGPVGTDHYDLWKSHFGATAGTGSIAGLTGLSVPEPSGTTLVVMVWGAFSMRRSVRWRKLTTE